MIKKITVYGMTSEACRRTIIAKLQSLKGIDTVSVNLPYSLVEVDFTPEVITLDHIKKIIQTLNYDPI